jgi:cytosine/adenosine deaminase-related metal-dependent hydrolase
MIALTALVASVSTAAASRAAPQPAPWDPGRGILIAGATVVTMDDQHSVIPFGRVLVRNGSIVAVWSGPKPPRGVSIGDASVVEAGPQDLLFPGLINLHDHPSFDFLEPWLPPSSDAIPAQGKAGTDPYANRYQWGAAGSPTASPEEQRLIGNPAGILNDSLGLGLSPEVDKYAEVGALLGGETADVGVSGALVHSVDHGAFGGRVAPSYSGPIAALDGTALSDLRGAMVSGQVDAWMLHLAEGVRDGDRRPGDTFSSRAELQTLKAKGLLTDMTVIVHGTGLERADFGAMRAAPTIRADGVGDGCGAKLVWSPLSNLLLYGKTANVYDALAEGVLVSLGTDWTPSGSRTLLHELKIADVAARDPRVLGVSRSEVPALAVDRKPPVQRLLAEAALDRTLVDMVTRNPALTLRWYDRVGSIEAGKAADLMLVRWPAKPPPAGVPPTVYRALINARERDVELVLVGGTPLAGDVPLLTALKPGDNEVVSSSAGGFSKAVDATTGAPVPAADEPLAQVTSKLETGLAALGGDSPPPGGGPGPPTNTYSYLKAHVAGGAAAGLPDPVFRGLLAGEVGTLPDGSLNIERIQLDPLLEDDDDFAVHELHGDIDPGTGLLADPTPPYKLYPANLNQIGPLGNPFQAVP